MNKKVKSGDFSLQFFGKNRRGLSGVIVAILIICIAIIAVGIVWFVLNGIIEEQSASLENSSSSLFKTCVQAGFYMMNDSFTKCGGDLKYIGGEKCCTIKPTA